MLEFWVDPDSPYHRELFAEHKQFVFYCASAWRSALATRTVQEMGMENVCHMAGGFNAWKEAERDIEDLFVGARSAEHVRVRVEIGLRDQVAGIVGRWQGASFGLSDDKAPSRPGQPTADLDADGASWSEASEADKSF